MAFRSRGNVQPYQFEPAFSVGEEPSVCDADSEEENTEDEHQVLRMVSTEWCCCGNCVSMPSEDECYCCQELDVLNEKFDTSGVECITEHEKFETVCLDVDVLATALVAMHNSRGNPVPDPVENRTWRLAAYRQFTWWAHGVLGKKRRRIIPACVVKAIRRQFPEESGTYEGFKPASFVPV